MKYQPRPFWFKAPKLELSIPIADKTHKTHRVRPLYFYYPCLRVECSANVRYAVTTFAIYCSRRCRHLALGSKRGRRIVKRLDRLQAQG